MLLDDFDYDLPTSLIATRPLAERSQSRLLCVDAKTENIQHKHFHELVNLLNPDDLLIFNNTRVIRARLFGTKATGGKIELLIERILNEHEALVHLKASKTPKPGTLLHFAHHIDAEVLGRADELFHLKFSTSKPLLTILDEIGHIPLPPYMNRSEETEDQERYQTVYAEVSGSAAAPTAGLHFDTALLDRLKEKGIEFAYVTLHVGAGTFQPVRAENITEHKMHKEWIEVNTEVCEKIARTKQKNGRVIAVGTTSVRSLETAALSGELKPYSGETDIFIYPGFQFRVIDSLITNFHLPKSSLLMLVSAFSSLELIKKAYQTAIEKEYRFFSYGDAMMITGKNNSTNDR